MGENSLNKTGLKKWTALNLILMLFVSIVSPISAASRSTEWNRILKSMTVTQKNLQKASEKDQSVTSKLMSDILQGPYSLNTNGELIFILSDFSSPFLKGAGVQLIQKKDNNTGTYLVEGNLNKNKEAIISGGVFSSDSLIALNLKELWGDLYLGINPITLDKDIRQSTWADKELRESIEQGLDISSMFKAQDSKLQNKQIKDLLLKYMSLGKDISTKNKAQKTGSTTLELENGKIKCDEYTITLNKEWIHNYIDKISLSVKNDKDLERFIMGQTGYQKVLISEIDIPELISEVESVAEELKNIISKDIIFKCYISEKDEIIKVIFETVLGNAETGEEYYNHLVDTQAEITLGDGKNIASGIKGKLKMVDDSESFIVNYNMKKVHIDNERTILYDLRFNDSKTDVFKFIVRANYDESKTTDNIDLNATVQMDYATINASAKGNLHSDVKTSSIKAQFNDIEITSENIVKTYDETLQFNEDSVPDTLLRFKGDIVLSKIDVKDIHINKDNVKMVLKMSEKEMDALNKQIEINYEKLMEKVEGLFFTSY